MQHHQNFYNLQKICFNSANFVYKDTNFYQIAIWLAQLLILLLKKFRNLSSFIENPVFWRMCEKANRSGTQRKTLRTQRVEVKSRIDWLLFFILKVQMYNLWFVTRFLISKLQTIILINDKPKNDSLTLITFKWFW